jgi:hypothetical protein
MLNILNENGNYFLTLGYDYVTKQPVRKLVLTKEEVTEIANTFTEDFAVLVGLGEAVWAFNELKLVEATEHPLGWTDDRERTILHYKELSWHMIAPEIAELGKLAQRALGGN